MTEPSKEFTCVGTVQGTIKGDYEHSLHIDKYPSNIQSVCSSLNNITDIMCSWFSKIEKKSTNQSQLPRSGNYINRN